MNSNNLTKYQQLSFGRIQILILGLKQKLERQILYLIKIILKQGIRKRTH